MTETASLLIGMPSQWRLAGGVRLARSQFALQGLRGGDAVLLARANLSQAHPKRQAEFLAGRQLCRAAFGIEELGRGPMQEPIWPMGRAGAISHSGASVACIAGSDRRLLGVDLEAALRPTAQQVVGKRVLTEEEARWLAPLPDEARALLLGVIFSAKECAYKAVFPWIGRRLPFDCAALLPMPARSWGRWRMRLTGDLAPGFLQGAVLRGGFVWEGDMVLTWMNQPRDTCPVAMTVAK
ncbi:4'-phosphopantetheinyl transferase family protein [Swaminathania salitolerans]|uniref:Enterobactin synthase component D n=1 Tax=Swaminathania salitolerans TaxID=182838 RepID=A0A511BSW8_9PROT|nr:4'-phosphopantetheinyl transferase superfamily protein [Swaminathania salitolerans]GBQ09262.1 multifunctional 4'-phosphopantetheinyl transferase PcpS [Swaminathania salitolerans LMG 21291]GEL01038.1 4'-phosphopantetheinyl transferase [Swaminathania salitolerans]